MISNIDLLRVIVADVPSRFKKDNKRRSFVELNALKKFGWITGSFIATSISVVAIFFPSYRLSFFTFYCYYTSYLLLIYKNSQFEWVFMNKKIIVIVNGYSSGQYYLPECHRRYVNCIHISSIRDLNVIELQGIKYLKKLRYKDEINSIIKEIEIFKPIAILNASEGDNYLADQLGVFLNLISNNPETSKSRRDKYEMYKALIEHDINTIPQMLIANEDETQYLCKQLGDFPLIIKPLSSVNSEDVYVCYNENMLIDNFKKSINQKNWFGNLNKTLLAQKFIPGQEYIINSVTYNGFHYITDIWLYEKVITQGSNRMCLSATLIELKGEIQRILIDYTRIVLDALDFKFGPAHSEIIYSKEHGPLLVETGARPMGGSLPPKLFREAMGYSQIDATLDAILDPDSFYTMIKTSLYKRKTIKVINLISNKTGKLKSLVNLPKVRELQSYYYEIMNVDLGDKIYLTKDGHTCPGHIILLHESSDIISQDEKTIRELELDMYLTE